MDAWFLGAPGAELAVPVAAADAWPSEPPDAGPEDPEAPAWSARFQFVLVGSSAVMGRGPRGGGAERVSSSIVAPTPPMQLRLWSMSGRFRSPAWRSQTVRTRDAGARRWRRTGPRDADWLSVTGRPVRSGAVAAGASVSISVLFRERVFFVFFLGYFGRAHGTLAMAAAARWTVSSRR